jgi:carboxyl-terminal processing protease
MEAIEDAREMRDMTSVSLNMEERRAERAAELERSLARENERRVALGLEPIESLDDLEDGEFPDILLDQAAGIVTDLATLRQIQSEPPRTAQVQP